MYFEILRRAANLIETLKNNTSLTLNDEDLKALDYAVKSIDYCDNLSRCAPKFEGGNNLYTYLTIMKTQKRCHQLRIFGKCDKNCDDCYNKECLDDLFIIDAYDAAIESLIMRLKNYPEDLMNFERETAWTCAK